MAGAAAGPWQLVVRRRRESPATRRTVPSTRSASAPRGVAAHECRPPVLSAAAARHRVARRRASASLRRERRRSRGRAARHRAAAAERSRAGLWPRRTPAVGLRCRGATEQTAPDGTVAVAATARSSRRRPSLRRPRRDAQNRASRRTSPAAGGHLPLRQRGVATSFYAAASKMSDAIDVWAHGRPDADGLTDVNCTTPPAPRRPRAQFR